MSIYATPTGSNDLISRIRFRYMNDGFYGWFGEECEKFRLPPDWRLGVTIEHYNPEQAKMMSREQIIAFRRLNAGMEVYRHDGMRID